MADVGTISILMWRLWSGKIEIWDESTISTVTCQHSKFYSKNLSVIWYSTTFSKPDSIYLAGFCNQNTTHNSCLDANAHREDTIGSASWIKISWSGYPRLHVPQVCTNIHMLDMIQNHGRSNHTMRLVCETHFTNPSHKQQQYFKCIIKSISPITELMDWVCTEAQSHEILWELTHCCLDSISQIA